MQLARADLTIGNLRKTADFKNLTFRIGGISEGAKGFFFYLWRDGEVLSIQAEPYHRDSSTWLNFSSEWEAFVHIQYVLQTMLDNLKFGTENNWAHLVRQKDNCYSLIYTRKEFVHLKCPVWTKKVHLDDIEITRIAQCALWEGIYEGKDVDLFMGIDPHWSQFVAYESLGHKLMNEAGVSHYTFELLAHVYKNGMAIGVMCEPIIGRRVCPTDRAAVFAAVADIQRHGILLGSLQAIDILITPKGVRFLNISAVKFYRDHDKLASLAEKEHWAMLARTFGPGMNEAYMALGSRGIDAYSYVIPRLPSPGRPVYTTPEMTIFRFVWSVLTQSPSGNPSRHCALLRFEEQQRKGKSTRDHGHRRRSKTSLHVPLAPLDCMENRFEELDQATSVDEPFDPRRHSSQLTPYARPKKKLLLPSNEA